MSKQTSKKKKALKRMKKRASSMEHAAAEGSYSVPRFAQTNITEPDLDAGKQAWEDWARKPYIYKNIPLPRPKRGRPRIVKPEDILEVVRAALTHKPALVSNPFVTRFAIDNMGLIYTMYKEGKL